MIIIYNTVGLIVIAIPALIAVALVAIFDISVPLAFLITGTLALVADLAYRFRRANFLDVFVPTKGGHVFFVPVWVIAAILVAMAAYPHYATQTIPAPMRQIANPDYQTQATVSWTADPKKLVVEYALKNKERTVREVGLSEIALINSSGGNFATIRKGRPDSDGLFRAELAPSFLKDQIGPCYVQVTVWKEGRSYVSDKIRITEPEN